MPDDFTGVDARSLDLRPPLTFAVLPTLFPFGAGSSLHALLALPRPSLTGATSTSVSYVTEHPSSSKVRFAVNHRAGKPEPMLSPCNRCSVQVPLTDRKPCLRVSESAYPSTFKHNLAMLNHAFIRLLSITICNNVLLSVYLSH